DGPEVKPPFTEKLIPLEQNPAHADDLKHGRDLAENSRTHPHFPDGHLNHHESDQQKHVAPNDGYGKPLRQPPQIRLIQAEQNHAGNEQQFVGEWIEDSAEFALLIVTSRDVAIHAIANCSE